MTSDGLPPPPREPRLALALLFLGSLLAFAFSAHGYLENTDAEITMHASRAWWQRGGPGLVGPGRETLLAGGQSSWPAEQAIVGAYLEDPKLPRYGRMGIDGKGYVWFPIGHQALFVPAMALADLCARLWPDTEARFRELKADPLRGQFFFERFFASFLSPLAAAGTVIALWLLLRALGVRAKDALIAIGVATLCTQFWAGSRETLSDMPGTFFLVACAALVARYARPLPAGGDPGTLLLAGLLGGLGVLVRYPQALPLAGLGMWAAHATWRAKHLVHLVWFAAGGLPALALLLYANQSRFGDPLETGYSGGVGFSSYPLLYGLPLLFLAFGKGMLWFSLPLWSAFAQLGKRAVRSAAPLRFVLLTFVVPLPLYATLHYWAAGQCWGIRYLTGVIVLFVAVALALGRPWQSSPRTFWAIAALGFVLSAGGIVTSYVGHQQYAYLAAPVEWQRPPNEVDNNVNFEPRYSPLHGHWVYAWLAASGRIESGRSEDSTEPLFGVRVTGTAPPRREDSGFRHLWWRYVRDVWPGFPSALVGAGLAVAALALLALGARGLLRADAASGRT